MSYTHARHKTFQVRIKFKTVKFGHDELFHSESARLKLPSAKIDIMAIDSQVNSMIHSSLHSAAIPSAPHDNNPHISRHVSPPSNSFGSSARNILADMDYSDYVSDPSPAATDLLKRLVEQAVWKYAIVSLGQPFEVAKTVLQVFITSGKQKRIENLPSLNDSKRRPAGHRHLPSDDDSEDSASYFTSSAPLPHSSTHPRGRRRRLSSSPDGIPRVHQPQSPPRNPLGPHILDLKSSSSVTSALSSLWNREGAWGVWKGTNCTFVYSILLSTVTAFVRSFLSALLGLQDPGLSGFLTASGPSAYAGGLDITSSSSPLSSLAVAVSAAGVAGIFLAPLDIARTKLILTPSTHPPRSILTTLKTLPSWLLPFSIAPTAILHAALPTLISASTPLFLRTKLGIDPVLTPNLYSVSTFCSQMIELGVKLPLETVLRRGQMAVARSTPQIKSMATIVEVGPYNGLFGTMSSILYEEGDSRAPSSASELSKGGKGAPGMKVNKIGQSQRKQQGVGGLYRGWRVGMWGLVGVWGAATIGGAGGKGGEF
ncbi:uncharacterized protein KY384_005246 [Bacidia gigantensis]|uniref:uncharacterized protein n=1 Tax=Bacidia gigantensis TaxID=2732470 RepID=UPI001D0542C1|nr:uncharacterized protein KY384_005246 [Bacidia gigantensis]KAG8529765.1 hypothetical protein KY384_005246 [Bacidia gigantensis]